MNDVEVVVHFGFYNGKLVKIIITGPPVVGLTGQAKNRIDEALNTKYGKPQLDISKKDIARLWGRRDMKVQTKDGTWSEEFPAPPTMQTWPHWWLFDERVLVASVASGAGGGRIEIKDVPLLVEAMNAEAQAYKDQKENAAKKSAKEDF